MNKPHDIKMFDYLEQFEGIEKAVMQAIARVAHSGQLMLATEVKTFEDQFSKFLNAPLSGVGVANGTDAIVVCLMALGIGEGAEVITTANTAVPTVSAIRMAHATPVFVDVDKNTALIDLQKIEAAITPRTKAIIPVHLFGNMVDMSALMALAQKYHIKVIEDCAQAHGASLNGRMAGTFGDAAAYSFYPTKNLGAMGDGGLSLSSDPYLIKEMRRIRMYGFDQAYYSEREGINSRLHEMQAAILNVKLPQLPAMLIKRRHIAKLYTNGLSKGVTPMLTTSSVNHAYHLYVVKVGEHLNRDLLRMQLQEKGINTGIHYPHPIHLMRGYQFLGYEPSSLPATEQLATQIVSLPIYPELSDSSVERVIQAVNETVDA